MDPTATLSEIRYLIKAWQSGNRADAEFYAELTTHVQNLDEWITKGGHLPTPWPAAAPPVRPVRRRRALTHPPTRRN
jgi:hypothetical protein